MSLLDAHVKSVTITDMTMDSKENNWIHEHNFRNPQTIQEQQGVVDEVSNTKHVHMQFLTPKIYVSLIAKNFTILLDNIQTHILSKKNACRGLSEEASKHLLFDMALLTDIDIEIDKELMKKNTCSFFSWQSLSAVAFAAGSVAAYYRKR